MVVLPESYLQHIEYQFLQTALTHHIALKSSEDMLMIVTHVSKKIKEL